MPVLQGLHWKGRMRTNQKKKKSAEGRNYCASVNFPERAGGASGKRVQSILGYVGTSRKWHNTCKVSELQDSHVGGSINLQSLSFPWGGGTMGGQFRRGPGGEKKKKKKGVPQQG